MTNKTLTFLNNALTWAGVVAFIVLVIISFLADQLLCLKICLTCSISFCLVSILRKVINLPRPKLEGGIYNKRDGESFPSRHTFSMMMIGLSWINLNIVVGMVVCGLAILLGGIRIAMGAHYPRDIYGAIVIALTFAGAGYLFF